MVFSENPRRRPQAPFDFGRKPERFFPKNRRTLQGGIFRSSRGKGQLSRCANPQSRIIGNYGKSLRRGVVGRSAAHDLAVKLTDGMSRVGHQGSSSAKMLNA